MAPHTFSHHHDLSLHSNKPSMPFSVPSHIMDRPQWHPNQRGRFLCSAVGSSWAAPLSTPQVATVRISWKPDLTSSGPKTGQSFGPWFVLNATLHLFFSSSRKSAAPLLLDQVDEAAPWLLPETHHQHQSLSKLSKRSKVFSPADPDRAVAAQIPVSSLFLSQVSELVPNTFRRMPRLSEYDFGEQAGDSNLFVQVVVAHIAAAAVPHPVLQHFRSCQVTPLAKPTGSHRQILMMSFLRRLAPMSVIHYLRVCFQFLISVIFLLIGFFIFLSVKER